MQASASKKAAEGKNMVLLRQLFFVAVILGISAASIAQQPADGDEKKFFKDGTKAYSNGKYEEAATAFRAAYAIKPSWKLLFNIGQAEASCKRYGIALDAFERYLAEGGDEITAQRRKEVDSEIEKLQPLVGSVDIIAPSGVSVWVDGIDMGTTPFPGRLRLTSGVEHRMEFRKDGTVLDTQVVKLARQESRDVKMTETPSTTAAATAPATASPEPAVPVGDSMTPDERKLHKMKRQAKALKIAGWVSLGVGVAGIAGGAVLMATADTSGGTADTTDAATESATRWEGVGLLVIGCAAAVTGAVLLGVGAKKKKNAAQFEQTISATPIADVHGAGLLIRGTF